MTIMIIAGEPSGDLHGSALIKELIDKRPDLKITGIGGDKMISAGMTNLYHIKEMAFLGFTEVIRHIPYIRKVQKNLIKELINSKIKTVVLIDYPGFNINFAKKIQKMGIKIIYFISPQIWAWGKGRIKKIRKLIDKMLVVFPFEKEFYSENDIDVEYVGHPLIERFENYRFLSKNDLFSKYNLDPEKEILLLMPGSRAQELKNILPETILAAKKLSYKYNFQIILLSPSNLIETNKLNLPKNLNINIAGENHYDFMKHSKFGIIKSGTSTLEAGILGLPMVVVYATSNITYWIGQALIRISNIAMINILAGKNIVNELIQRDVTEKKIFEQSSEILDDPDKYNLMKENLLKMKQLFGRKKASENSAAEILKMALDAES